MNPPRYDIRLATSEDVAVLPEVERLAGLLFKTYPGDLGIPEEVYEHPNSVETFAAAQRAGRLWVATTSGGELVGLALVMEIEGYAHLDELDRAGAALRPPRRDEPAHTRRRRAGVEQLD